MIVNWLDRRASLTPSRSAVIEPKTGIQLTYEQLNKRAENLAMYLKDKNVGHGDRVVLIAKNSVSHLDFLFACTKIGAIFTPLNWRLKENELIAILNDNQPSILAYESDYCFPFFFNLNQLHLIDVESNEYHLIVNEVISSYFKPYPVKPEDAAVIIYTSGSTGVPKGAIISHKALITNALNTLPGWGVNQNDRTIAITPMFHTAGLFGLVTPLLLAGGEIIIQPTFRAQETYELIMEYQPTKLFMVPTMYYDLMNNVDIETMTSVDLLISGGAPMSKSVCEAFKVANLPLIDSYGLTEVGPNNFWKSPYDTSISHESVGKPILFNQIKLINHQGEEVEQGDVGELLIGGDHAFSGYWNNLEASEEAFYEGYVRTGDLARMDEFGNYYIVGRQKEMIITGGENVFPKEVESVLNNHPLVHDIIVVGYPNKKWGESVGAAVILEEATTNYETILDDYSERNLAVYKKPKTYLELESFPRNAVGKIDKKEIIKMIIQNLEE